MAEYIPKVGDFIKLKSILEIRADYYPVNFDMIKGLVVSKSNNTILIQVLEHRDINFVDMNMFVDLRDCEFEKIN